MNRRRFIPVDTGNTNSLETVLLFPSVYPRGYGEHSLSDIDGGKYSGLSPWIRGTLHSLSRIFLLIRFIPVDTGNTNSFQLPSALAAVYPRGYGEHFMARVGCKRSRGLSPWIRGTRLMNPLFSSALRFIPVDTGNTVSSLTLDRYPVDTGNTSLSCLELRNLAVYPRGYGEHPDATTSNVFNSGLSPWIRGTLLFNTFELFEIRFIPVDTGNTSAHS